MQGEITRKSVLLECLEYERGLWKLTSKNYDTLEPMKGMDKEFDEQREKCRILEDLIHAYESENVRKALAEWQQEEKKITGVKGEGHYLSTCPNCRKEFMYFEYHVRWGKVRCPWCNTCFTFPETAREELKVTGDDIGHTEADVHSDTEKRAVSGGLDYMELGTEMEPLRL